MPKQIKVDLRMKDNMSKPLDKARGKVQQFTGTIAKSIKKVAKLQTVIVVALATAGARAAVLAASKMEVFATQLEVVQGSAERAAESLEAIREFARQSPLETEDVVKAYVKLRAVGIDPTIKQMETLGGVAVLMNRKLVDIMDGFIGAEKEVLRRLGIEIDRTGSKAVIQSGNIRREVNKDMASIREALIDVWGERFPNAMEKASETSKSKTAIMKSEVFELAAAVGDKLLPAWNSIVEAVGKAASKTRQFFDPKEEKIRKKKVKILKEELKEQERVLTVKRIELTQIELAAKFEAEAYNNKLLFITELEDVITKNKIILGQLQKQKDLGGTGELGPKEIEKVKKAKGDPVADASKATAAIELMQIAIDRSRAGLIERQILQQEILDQAFQNELAQTELLANATEQRISYRELELQKEKEIIDERNQFADQSMKDRIAESNFEKNAIINNSIQLGQTLTGIAADSIKRSKANAKKKKRLLTALAIADAAAGAVAGVKHAMDTGPVIGPILAALAVAQVVAMTAGQIAAIQGASFQRGTSFAGGGASLVGESGPEIRNLRRGDTITTNVQSRQLLGGNSFSPTIIINGNADASTVDDINTSLENFKDKFMGAIRHGYINWNEIGVQTI